MCVSDHWDGLHLSALMCENFVSKMKNEKVSTRTKICKSLKFPRKGQILAISNFRTRAIFFIFHFKDKVSRGEMILMF